MERERYSRFSRPPGGREEAGGKSGKTNERRSEARRSGPWGEKTVGVGAVLKA